MEERLTILQIFLNEGGMFAEDAQMSSIKTFATIRSCVAFLCNSSGDDNFKGSSSRLRSCDVNLSTTFCKVALR